MTLYEEMYDALLLCVEKGHQITCDLRLNPGDECTCGCEKARKALKRANGESK